MPVFQPLIVDDEPLGRERIRSLLDQDNRFASPIECQNGIEAIDTLRSHQIDLVFLDIQMPEVSGFDVVREIGPEGMPPVLFVTAYDQHALKAFELHAFDYLLKPFSVDRFNEAVDHAIRRIDQMKKSNLSSKLTDLLLDLQPQKDWLKRIMVKSRSRVYFILTDQIDWIESAGNYVSIHVGGQQHLLRQTMTSLEKQLDPTHFMRIHRSTIINLNRVSDLYPMASGEYQVRLTDGTKLTMSRTYKDRLNRFS